MPRQKKDKGELFDIKNLEQAKKLVQEINSLISNGGAFTSNHGNILKYIEDMQKVEDLYKKLNALQNKHMEDISKQDNEYYKHIKEQISGTEKYIELLEKRIAKEKESKEVFGKDGNPTEDQFKASIKGAQDKSYETLKKQASQKYEQLPAVMKALISEKDFLKDVLPNRKSFNSQINKYVLKENEQSIKTGQGVLKNNAVQSIANDFAQDKYGIKNGFGKFNVATKLYGVASKTLKAGAETLKKLAVQGLNNQTNTYEDTFTGISVRNRTTRSEYYGAQSKINNILSSNDLRNNIASSDVQKMWSDLASKGIEVDLTKQQTTQNAIETILTNQIVPYLDMSSAYMQKVAEDNPGLMKQVRGIGLSVQNVEGSNVVANEYLQDMMDNLTPMGELANQELGIQYADTLGQLENLRSQGLSDAEIGQMYGKVKTMVEDPYKAISNGDTLSKLTVANMMASGEDLKDSSAVLGALTSNVDRLSNSVVNGNWSSLYGGIIANSFGGDAGLYTQFSEKGISALQSINAGKEAGEGVNAAAEQATTDYKSDRNQTNKKLQDVTLENLMNELAVAKEWMGNFTDLIVTAIEGLGTLLVGWLGTKLVGGIVGKGIGALAGSAAGGAGAGLLAAGGGILLGATAGLMISKAITDAAKKKAAEENNNDASKQDMQIKGLAEDLGVSEDVAGVMKAGSNMYNSDKNFLGATFDNYQAAELFGAKLGMFDTLDEKDFIQTMDESTKKGDALAYNKAKIGRSLIYKGIGINSTMLPKVAQAWVIGLNSQGYEGNNSPILEALSQTIKGTPTPTDQNVVDILNSGTGMSRQEYNNIVGIMRDADMWLWSDSGKWILPSESDYDKAIKLKGIDKEKAEFLNSHRQGLDEVPYDDYPALLHEGEAVLTASTTNELRNLIDTYRELNSESVQFDVIIQQQTVELVNKMDQIIKVIDTNNMYTNMNNEGESSSRVRNSMLKMLNTKSAFNLGK